MPNTDVAELEVIAASVLAGQNDTEIADVVGLSPRTYYRRKALPETQELIAQARRETASAIREGVVEAALVGLERLHAVVSDPDSPAGAAVSASRYLVDLAVGPGGLSGLAQRTADGGCGACGHHRPDDADRDAARADITARMDEVRERLTAGA